MLDKKAISNDLTKLFIQYQYRLDNPMPNLNESYEDMVFKYRSDHVFHSKVNAIVSRVMMVVTEHEI